MASSMAYGDAGISIPINCRYMKPFQRFIIPFLKSFTSAHQLGALSLCSSFLLGGDDCTARLSLTWHRSGRAHQRGSTRT
eukprot:8568814-Pyramimonas_sp.AAC.1